MPKSRQQNVALMKELIFPLRLHLYHLSEITVLHETAQNAGFSRLFDAFFKPFHEMPKKKTVNLSLKNANLCFGVVSTNNFAVSVKAFSLTTAREMLGDEKISIITFATYPLTSFLSANEFFSDSTALQHRLNEKLFLSACHLPTKTFNYAVIVIYPKLIHMTFVRLNDF